MSATPEKPAYPSHMEKASAGLFEHYCTHEGCKAGRSFGFEKRYGLEWYCGEHKGDPD